MSRRSLLHASRSRTRIGLASLLPILAIAIPVNVALLAGEAATSGPAAAQTGGNTTYSVDGNPAVTTITNGTSAAPWNSSQGDPDFPNYASQSPGTLLPTYTPGGATENVGGVTEPNLAVYPAADSGTDNDFPYPSGTVGSPGPLTGYCGTGGNATAANGSPTSQPADTTLPFAPAYFPHIVRNSDGSLTGYFDYRPKDTDEAIVAATSTDNGADWTYEGEALEQNPAYCPNADINDDGQGHPNVLTVGGVSRLYTLQRPAGDNDGVGMLVHTLTPTANDPLAGLPSSEEVGIDPDAFATNSAPLTVPLTGGTPVNIPLTQTGTSGSPEQLIPNSANGGFVDLNATPSPGNSAVITCTGATSTSLTGCTTNDSSGISISNNDLIEQVIGTTSASGSIMAGPNSTTGDMGTSSVTVNFVNPSVTASILNANAPNRVYVNGTPVYCTQDNANPTTKIENCTTGPNGSSLSFPKGAVVTSDPIIPSTATAQTNGLVSPDGIVGTLPSYPGLPAGETAVMYTEKVLNYYVAGITTNGSGSTLSGTIGFTPSTSMLGSSDVPSDMPAPSSVTSGNPVTVYLGFYTPSSGTPTSSGIYPVTCTGLTAATTDSLTGCTTTAPSGWFYNSTSMVGAPGAAIVPNATLGETGEGAGANPSAKNIAKLMKNNEDLSLLRVAYTSDGVNFYDSALANDGIISDQGTSQSSGSYTGISDPNLQTSPSNLDEYAGGQADATEMRFVGSAGSIVVNPDGSYGLFLSGAWAADGDSDSFNQILYSSSTDGENWTVPVDLVSTDYTFSASSYQDANSGALGVSAYYSGRAYGPSVVQNPDGSLTMVFAGYRLPKPIENAGTVLGTNPSDQYTVGTSDPALYRNIMVVTLQSATSPGVSTTTSLATSDSTPVVGEQVTYTATVAPVSPGTGIPTGTVTFTGDAGTLCTNSLDEDASDQATCDTTYEAPGSDSVTATYNSDSNYATSTSNSVPETISLSSSSTTSAPGSASVVLGSSNTDTATVTATGSADPTGTVSFYECGPTSGAQPCTTGTEFDTETLSGTANPDEVTSASFTPTGAGYWCFAAVYSGDTNYTGSSDSTSDECFTVKPAASTSVSKPSSGGVVLKTPAYDTVTVTGNTAGGAPTGRVTFYECGPGPAPQSCTDQANIVGTTTITPGVTDTSTAKSQTFKPTVAGWYCFGAYYSGDSNYNNSSDTTTDECFYAGSAPTIASFSPGSGKPGTRVTITGKNLGDATKVRIGAKSATILTDTATKITVDVPSGVATASKDKAIEVVTQVGTATSKNKFKVT